MDPAAVLRDLRGGHTEAVRSGLFVLVLGALITLMLVILLSPSVSGLVSVVGRALDAPTVARPAARATPPLTAQQRMLARRTAVKAAISQTGVRERRTNQAARIISFRQAVVGRGENPRLAEPWCADFVSWAWARAGVPLGFGGRGSDYVPELVAWAQLSRSWRWARDGYNPRSGDLIVYRANGSRAGHIGLVVKLQRGRVYTVEGNLSDRVMRRSVKPWDPAVTGFISPV